VTPSTFHPPAETSEIRAALIQARFYAAHPGTFFRQLPAILFRRLPTKAYCRLTAERSVSPTDAAMALSPDLDRARAGELLDGFHRNQRFATELDARFREFRGRPASLHLGHELLYLLVRACRPSMVFETGVFDGFTSACILLALDENRGGTLVSVDLPAVRPVDDSIDQPLPAGCQPGWVIPDYLRGPHELHLGDSRELLPRLLARYPRIDLFFHDSLHTFEHMSFEYQTAWPHLTDGGILASDDILWNTAFPKFCRGKGKRYVRVGAAGAVRKS